MTSGSAGASPSRLLGALLVLALVVCDSTSSGADLSFSRDVRPILAENCFKCHGHDDQQRKAKLRLDLPDSETVPAKSGAIAIVPGNPEQSELVKRITASSPDDRMPPASSNKHLTPQQIETLKLWVAEGAKYEKHWAFVPPQRPVLPEVKDVGWCRTPIDRFILARLESERLKPSPKADKITLLRRLYLDLLGLPPTIDQVDAFLKDDSPDAYDRQVEKLLASPHYGERWGRHWLDAARYADSDGFEKDKQRFNFFYRDWVIGAFNRDLPYDQFIIEQIAGDQLPRRTQDQVVATGFLRNAMLNEEGGIDPEQFRMDAMIDRMDCIGKSILGLTIQCAQCHTHKFDPLTQKEYYRLFAFLNNDNEAQPVVYTPEEQMKAADLLRQMRETEGSLKHTSPDWEDRMTQWELEVSHDQPRWTVLHGLEHLGENAQRYLEYPDGSLLAGGYAPTKFTESFRVKTNLRGITAFRLELLTDQNLPCGGPGRSIWGTCALSEFSVDAVSASDPKKKIKVVFSDASSDIDQPTRDLEPIFDDKTKNKRMTGPVKFAIDGNASTAWGIDAGPGRRNHDRKAVFVCKTPLDFDGDVILTIHLAQNHGGWNSDDNQNNNLGRFRVSVTNAQGDIVADPLPARVRKILDIPRVQRCDQQVEEVFSYWRTTIPEWRRANDRIEALWQQWPQGQSTLALATRSNPRETHVLSRGDWLKPSDVVSAGVPAFLNQLPETHDASRLTLARWLVDRNAPTTARVYVNRIWEHYFGAGIVSTPEDFGYQGDPPSHRELLDWLAVEFMEPSIRAGLESAGGAVPWSIKHVHRLIVTSSAYRQSSRVTPELLEMDPYNRLLARGPRFRVEGEIIRDIALASSGLLNPEMGGRSIMPPAPAFLFLPPASYGPFPWHDETGPEKYRRGVYVFRRRSTPYPMLQTFDVPSGESSCVRRARSNSPLQALVTLNEPMFVECAQALAKKTIENGGATDPDRIAYAFRTVLARPPTDAESKELLRLFNTERERFAEGFLNPSEVATGNPQVPRDLPPSITPTQWAAYTVVSRVLLNLDEAITKE
ncbi:MAG TPA: PSD1 and planctomycete cytochrome C domain-containing protein [Tepidisphaeraceae bacterium]|nr:PSD1 and planctomycete cytochrome C domain-containing protein [Tepidisphaeraceae bacterium]